MNILKKFHITNGRGLLFLDDFNKCFHHIASLGGKLVEDFPSFIPEADKQRQQYLFLVLEIFINGSF